MIHPPPSGPDLLFVYGTLRPGAGHPMGDWLAARADWLGPARCAGARLCRVSWYPALLPGAPADTVAGDLYRLCEPAACWPGLDDFEGVVGREDDEYERLRLPVRLGDGAIVSAWVYRYRVDSAGLTLIPGGDWLAPDA